MKDRAWMAEALCKDMDTDIWFPPRGDHRPALAAKAICAECPVAAECLDYAMSIPDGVVGIFGGTSEDDRKRLRRGRRPRAEWELEPHGTEAAYRRHMRAHEKACPACKQAKALARATREERAS